MERKIRSQVEGKVAAALSLPDEMTIVEDSEEPPGIGRRPAAWRAVPDEKWDDWRWQLSHRIKTGDDLRQIINLTPEEEAGVAEHRFRMDITPYFASLMDPSDPNCPIRRQVVPTSAELDYHAEEMGDSLNEEAQSPVRGLVHRYPDRVLMLVTTQCASYCRYCTRSRLVGEAGCQFTAVDYDAQIDYISRTPSVRDVLISGGDPLVLAPAILERILGRLRAIEHVEVIRIGTRVPVFLPQRVDDELVGILRRYHPLWMNIHFNHPRELSPEVAVAVERLADAGIPLGSQTVLLAGVNDCPNVIKTLMHALVRHRVRPYYLYQCDLVQGAGHFRTSVAKGLEIMESLRGHTSGFAIPTFCIDAPGGGGKVPILPNYVISQSDERVVLRNFEGVISAYAQPPNYRGHDASNCEYCRAHASEPQTQEGVESVLHGRRQMLAPEGYVAEHHRVAAQRDTSGSTRSESPRARAG